MFFDKKWIHFLGYPTIFAASTDMISSESSVLDIPLYFSMTFSGFFFFFFLANLKVYVCDFLHLHIYDHAHSAGSANYCCKSITEADINPLERLLGNGFSNRSFLYSSFRAVPLFFILHNKQNPLVSISFLINSPRCHFYILSSDN